jgi:hypothetical protein
LNFPYANMKWVVRQWENTMISLFNNERIRIRD